MIPHTEIFDVEGEAKPKTSNILKQPTLGSNEAPCVAANLVSGTTAINVSPSCSPASFNDTWNSFKTRPSAVKSRKNPGESNLSKVPFEECCDFQWSYRPTLEFHDVYSKPVEPPRVANWISGVTWMNT